MLWSDKEPSAIRMLDNLFKDIAMEHDDFFTPTDDIDPRQMENRSEEALFYVGDAIKKILDVAINEMNKSSDNNGSWADVYKLAHDAHQTGIGEGKDSISYIEDALLKILSITTEEMAKYKQWAEIDRRALNALRDLEVVNPRSSFIKRQKF